MPEIAASAKKQELADWRAYLAKLESVRPESKKLDLSASASRFCKT